MALKHLLFSQFSHFSIDRKNPFRKDESSQSANEDKRIFEDVFLENRWFWKIVVTLFFFFLSAKSQPIKKKFIFFFLSVFMDYSVHIFPGLGIKKRTSWQDFFWFFLYREIFFHAIWKTGFYKKSSVLKNGWESFSFGFFGFSEFRIPHIFSWPH